MLRYLLLTFLGILIGFQKVQAQVNIELPNLNTNNSKSSFQKFGESRFINNYPNTKTIYCKLKVFDHQSALVYKFRTFPVKLQPGMNSAPPILFSKGIELYKDPDYIQSNALIKNGVYRIRIEMFSIHNQNLLGYKDKTLNLNNQTTVKLKYPTNGQVMKDSSFYFKWKSINKNFGGRKIYYHFVLKPVLPWQEPSEALNSNPVWYEKNRLATSQLFYPPNAKTFKKGVPYAWQVMVKTDNVVLGKSKPQVCYYHKKSDSTSGINNKDSASISDSGFIKELNFKDADINPSQKAESKLPKKTKAFSTSGKLSVEGYYSNQSTPRGWQPSKYVRTNVNPKVKLFGLPFGVNAFMTTEHGGAFDFNNPSFQLDRLNINFDQYAWKNSLKKQLKSKIKRYKKIDKKLNKDSPDLNQHPLKSYEKLQAKKSKIKRQYSEDYYKELEAAHQLQVVRKIENLDSLKTGAITRFKDSIPTDSLSKDTTLRKSDTSRSNIDSIYHEKQAKLDSLRERKAQLNKYNQLQRYLTSKEDKQKKLADSLKRVNPELLNRFKEIQTSKRIQELGEQQKQVGSAIEDRDLKENLPLSKKEKFFLNTKALNIGTFNPYFSKLTVSGISLQGINFEYQTERYYLNVAAGQENKHRYSFSSIRKSNKEKKSGRLLTGKVGLGGANETHLHFMFLTGKDYPDFTSTSSFFNHLIGTEGQLKLSKHLTVKGEFVKSIVNQSSVVKKNKDHKNTLIRGSNSVAPKGHQDLAYGAEVKYQSFTTNTKVKGTVRKIGAGYYSMAAPYLRKDNLLYKAEIQQPLFDNKITIRPYYQREIDNTINWKSAYTINKSYGASVNLNFANWPFLNLTYAPYVQSVNFTSPESNRENYRVEMKNFMASSSYQHQLLEYNAIANLNYNYLFNAKNPSDTNFPTRKVHNFQASEQIQFKGPFNLTINANYRKPVHNTDSSEMYLIQSSLETKISKKLKNQSGVNYSNGPFNKNKSIGGFTRFAYKFNNGLSAILRLEKNQYQQGYFNSGSYNEWTGKVILNYFW